jgi:hypothetical protein
VIVYYVHYSDTFGDYDVSADGQCFVVVQYVDQGETPTITVVKNWIKEFPGQM